MVRIKRGVTSKARHKKILKQAKGYYGSKSRTYRSAFQAIIKSGQYSYRDRKQKKRKFRQLWIMQINAAVRKRKISYSNFIYNLKKHNININRKILANMAISNNVSFNKLIKYSIN
ncbi:50S ribosomal protein L20 [Enterobacteriaceae endosymbiont of Donacia versicolorea]|uniref:50S ribosomal protein L20 n=1 Tax=unclassified Enterobacteriaceae TaxID=36866 RepID=UPI0014499CB3|nr:MULTISPECIES: 50S ribosomal protein L20 [unclassified Enterobacteriaceae]QJC31980.1 50S ribosomal protein L20 [Enterobacteriaceae endosymbiont of Donacia versicolorea]QJC32384.1 50S ribosomal protein L20 [Enterobacteriaceae endosymbiont of Donacia dentata]